MGLQAGMLAPGALILAVTELRYTTLELAAPLWASNSPATEEMPGAS